MNGGSLNEICQGAVRPSVFSNECETHDVTAAFVCVSLDVCPLASFHETCYELLVIESYWIIAYLVQFPKGEINV
jgi:hypothetical protein